MSSVPLPFQRPQDQEREAVARRRLYFDTRLSGCGDSPINTNPAVSLVSLSVRVCNLIIFNYSMCTQYLANDRIIKSQSVALPQHFSGIILTPPPPFWSEKLNDPFI